MRGESISFLFNNIFEKILYATDLSESAAHAYAYAISLANIYGASISILHVLAEFSGEEFVVNMIDADTWKDIKDRHYAEARTNLIGKKRDHIAIREVLEAFSEEAKSETDDQKPVIDEVLIKKGSTADVILETAQELKCDLIVMGTHGQGSLTDMLIGSTAKRVVGKSPIPVLVIRLP
jgi:nucleotide-binding universal stress UspA family protein